MAGCGYYKAQIKGYIIKQGNKAMYSTACVGE